MTEQYRDKLIYAIDKLSRASEVILDRIINLGMAGEYKELQDTFEEGETFSFHLEFFEDLDDINVQNFLKLHKQMEELIETTININGITRAELDAWEGEDEEDEYYGDED